MPVLRRDPARVAAHHLDDHDPAVGLGRGVETVHAFGGEGDRGVEAEGDDGPVEIVVDGLGHTHDPQALSGEVVGDGEGAVPSDADEGVEATAPKGGQDLVGPVALDDAAVRQDGGIAQGVADAGRPEDRAAQVGDVAHDVGGQADDAAVAEVTGFEKAVVALANAVGLPPEPVGGCDHGADHGIETRRVASSGVDGDAAETDVLGRRRGASASACGARLRAGRHGRDYSAGAAGSRSGSRLSPGEVNRAPERLAAAPCQTQLAQGVGLAYQRQTPSGYAAC